MKAPNDLQNPLTRRMFLSNSVHQLFPRLPYTWNQEHATFLAESTKGKSCCPLICSILRSNCNCIVIVNTTIYIAPVCSKLLRGCFSGLLNVKAKSQVSNIKKKSKIKV